MTNKEDDIKEVSIDNIDDREQYWIHFYKSNNIKVIVTSSVTGEGIVELKELLRNRDSVFSGHSGAGKSSLINALEPGLDLRVGDVSEYSNKGTHTTTRSRLIQWSFGGYHEYSPAFHLIINIVISMIVRIFMK